ncbi:hypothetical protein HNQ40_000946 [Algisphaera agarilytica]|uniref:Uncharacterized protein n=1 Tax=Algisphaera agarilytica TaxID=1385975 RepID=A0A7X0H4K2_9BACT|nr:hypothetical protein [Algisphaera agarilytica]
MPNLPGAADSARLSTALLLPNPSLIGSELDHTDEIFDLMPELGPDG